MLPTYSVKFFKKVDYVSEFDVILYVSDKSVIFLIGKVTYQKFKINDISRWEQHDEKNYDWKFSINFSPFPSKILMMGSSTSMFSPSCCVPLVIIYFNGFKEFFKLRRSLKKLLYFKRQLLKLFFPSSFEEVMTRHEFQNNLI